ncbi:hypothetical protein E1A91_D01G146400v1 [Gossypium mustelinum]|uniref:Cytochrome c biogenesis FC n=1 Tax=Gossypium mustelinum TaxID=34275 RepID=A0A5D2W714_GOSMU|nr:hypothetical protein E1A91_D01G146400v1 [Gossypium mustelinum]
MVQLYNFFFFIIFIVVPRGTAAPVLLKWFISRDVSTSAPFSNGTILLIPISSFPLLVYLHSRKFIRSMGRAKSGVLGDFTYLESFCGVLYLLFFHTFFFLPCDRSAKHERTRRWKRQTLQSNRNEQRKNDKMSRQLMAMAVGHDYYQKAPMKMNISHGGVCICMWGVILSYDPVAYIPPKLPPVFGLSCMRQKLIPRTVQRLSPTPTIMFTQRLPLGSKLYKGKERCCLRGLDHLHAPTFHFICGNLMIYKPSLTNDQLMFEHDESLRADPLLINFSASYKNGKLEHFLHRWIKNRKHNNFWLTMFPEKRYFRETTSTTKVAIHTNLFIDLYASIGTGSSRIGAPDRCQTLYIVLPLSRVLCF